MQSIQRQSPRLLATLKRPLRALSPLACTLSALFVGGIAYAAPHASPKSGSQDKAINHAQTAPIIDHEVKDINGDSVKLSSYRGKAVLIVNTASYCGYTRQYDELVKIQAEYEARGFSVLAFPCNDFGGQEPGSAKEIKSFCRAKFNINFPLFDKVRARGDKSPLYKTLTSLPAPLGGEIRWNFTKFLVNPKGEVIARFEPGDNPTSDKVKRAIETALPSK